MIHLFLVDRSDGRKIDLGRYRNNDLEKCIAVASRRHRFLAALETHGFDFHAEIEPGPYRKPKPEEQAARGEQLMIEGL